MPDTIRPSQRSYLPVLPSWTLSTRTINFCHVERRFVDLIHNKADVFSSIEIFLSMIPNINWNLSYLRKIPKLLPPPLPVSSHHHWNGYHIQCIISQSSQTPIKQVFLLVLTFIVSGSVLSAKSARNVRMASTKFGLTPLVQ